MKKRILIFLTVIMMIFATAGIVTACGGEKADYSVTVLSPSEEPMQGITVLWKNDAKTVRKATTGADGKATASLVLGTYSVALEGQGEGFSYTSVSVSSSMRNVILTLSAKKISYSATVTDKDGAPASGVTVTWSNATSAVGSAQTNANGVAECELAYGEYVVTLSDLPEGNVYAGAKTVTGANAAVTFALTEGASVRYKITVKSEGGLLFKNHPVRVYDGETLVSSGDTNDEGVYAFSVKDGDYTVTTTTVPEGYSFEPVVLSEQSHESELVLYSEIITSAPAADTTYVIGDIFHNYTFTTPYMLNGAVWSKSVKEILAEKDVLILNNWGLNCTYCLQEMPYMQEVYEKYGDQIEIVAVNNFSGRPDSNTAITDYAQNYTFPMMRDANNFTSKFLLTGWPLTVIIDRYGAIARIESGAIPSVQAWEKLVQKYIGDGYVQDFIPGQKVSEPITSEIAKPDVVLPADHYEKVAAAINDKNLFPKDASVVWYGESEYEYAWPFVLGTDPEVSPSDQVLYSSNAGKPSTMSVIYATVTVEAGKVFHFDYWAQTEKDADVLSIIWDGKIVKTITGNSEGWQTCYLYTDITNDSHTLIMAYQKDNGGDTGKDNVYIRRVGFANVSDLIDPTDMLRGAAYGTPAEGANKFPYYAETAIADDGYYHVDLSKLQNSQFAGNDNSPLLLANLMNATNWSGTSITTLVYGVDEDTGEYLVDCNFTINGVTRDYRNDLIAYLKASASSDVAGCVPVNQELHDILVEFMKKASGSKAHADQWLEICYFYSHYGDGEFVGNPIMGLMNQTAIHAEEGTHTANLTRNSYPFPSLIYTFTPQTSAVYEFKSLIPAEEAGKQAAQIWLYDVDGEQERDLAYCGDSRVVRDGVNEHNFELYYYMTAGHKYYFCVAFQMAGRGTYDFTITNMGQSKTVLMPASEDTYDMILDEEDNILGIELAGAVKTVQDKDGYYHAVNPDGTMGDFIYLDLIYASTTALGTIPITRLVDRNVDDPLQDDEKPGIEFLDYKFFDFRYRVVYVEKEDGTVGYLPQVDYSLIDGSKYRDYTQIVKGWLAQAPAEGEYAGMIKVNQQVVNFLKLYIEMRVNMYYQGTQAEKVLDNEWLRFCWYMRTFDSNNP